VGTAFGWKAMDVNELQKVNQEGAIGIVCQKIRSLYLDILFLWFPEAAAKKPMRKKDA
jgi:hypothetical protein